MKISVALGAVALALTTVHCAASAREAAHHTGDDLSWAVAASPPGLNHLWFAGQPDVEALRQAREQGITVVINLREPSEMDWDERQAAEDLGMTYYNVPVAKKGPFTPQAMDGIDALVAAHAGQQTLLHCSSGNRAAGWLAVYLVEHRGMTLEQALVVGRESGITVSAIEDRVTNYVTAPQAAQ